MREPGRTDVRTKTDSLPLIGRTGGWQPGSLSVHDGFAHSPPPLALSPNSSTGLQAAASARAGVAAFALPEPQTTVT